MPTPLNPEFQINVLDRALYWQGGWDGSQYKGLWTCEIDGRWVPHTALESGTTYTLSLRAECQGELITFTASAGDVEFIRYEGDDLLSWLLSEPADPNMGATLKNLAIEVRKELDSRRVTP